MEGTLRIALQPARDTCNGSMFTGAIFPDYICPPYGRATVKVAHGVPENLSEYRTEVMTVSSHSNVSDSLESQTEYRVAELLWQICPVFLFFFGTLGNCAILFTLRHLRLGRTSMHIYLRALALSDLCVLYTGLLRWWVRWMFKTDLRNEHVIFCKGHTWLVYVSLAVSAWLLVVMTFERMWSTCLPHRVSAFCTTRKALFFIVFILVFHGAIQSHFLVGMTLKKDNNSGKFICGQISKSYENFIHDIWPLVDICLLSILPFFCVIVGNAIIVWKTFLSLKTASQLNLSSGTSAQRRRRKASSMTVILLGLSALFLFTTSPVCVYNLWERGGSAISFQKTSAGKARLELIWAAINLAMYCNNSFNFYLYCLTGKKFRVEMRRRLTRNRSDSHSNAASGQSFQRFMILKDLNRVDTYLNARGSTFRASSVRFQNA